MRTFADEADSYQNERDTQQSHINKHISTDHLLNTRRSVYTSLFDKYTRFSPRVVFFIMICAVLLLDAILPLRDLWFHEALLTQLGPWPVAPSLLLFPGWRVLPPIPQQPPTLNSPSVLSSWIDIALLAAAFLGVFLVYLFALRRLPTQISRRFILRTTLALGLLFLLIPVVTSGDIYSYIAYARIGAIYHLNPLTAIPRTIHTDVSYPYVSWVDQPSAYGPTWALLTSGFQEIFALVGLGSYMLPMLLILRVLGLAMHMGSVALIWSISRDLQRVHSFFSEKKRLVATLAFAWNPLLLLEAATNAHNDTTLLFIILLTIWCLARARHASILSKPPRFRFFSRSQMLYIAPAILLSLATCLKINIVLVMPGVFFYQWLQTAGLPIQRRVSKIAGSALIYIGLTIALYAPFWQGGAILEVLKVNPATYRSINTLPATLGHLYDSVAALLGFPLAPTLSSPAERFFHTISIGLFVLIYALLCWQTLRSPSSLKSIYGLTRWMAITWFFYCAIGSPWFWPWYLVTFFGLYALIEAAKPGSSSIKSESIPQEDTTQGYFRRCQELVLNQNFVYTLIFGILTLYCLTATWGPAHSFVPGLPNFQWVYLSGTWAWLLPLFGLKLAARPSITQRSDNNLSSSQKNQIERQQHQKSKIDRS